MTRYARASGSKSSNQKLPQEATSWEVMQKQMEEAQRQAKLETKISNIINEISSLRNSVEFQETEWADFGEHNMEKKTKVSKESDLKKEGRKHMKNKIVCEREDSKKKRKRALEISSLHNSVEFQETEQADFCEHNMEKKTKVSKESDLKKEGRKHMKNKIVCEREDSKKKRKRALEISSLHNSVEFQETEQADFCEHNMEKKTKVSKESDLKKEGRKHTKNKIVCEREDSKKKRERALNEEKDDSIQSDGTGGWLCEEGMKSESHSVRKSKNEKPKRKNARTTENVNESENVTEQNDHCHENYANEGRSQRQNKKQEREKVDKIKKLKTPGKNTKYKPTKENARFNKQMEKREKHDKPYKRRKVDQGAVTLNINGQDVVIVKFDGFPVQKKDADILKDMRKKLKGKGVPKSEIEQVMKLERRKAEKALARLRKQVCFKCRMSGHVLSECPEISSAKNYDSHAVGVCFKCGSTEHKSVDCHVNRGDGFRFAKCFVCKEVGHIARQCPDNPRGLYPNGGACNVCGSVTHLKKDCPDLIKEKEEQTITLETMNNNALEVLDEDIKKVKFQTKEVPRKKKNIVKF